MSKLILWIGTAVGFLLVLVAALLLFAKPLMELGASAITGRDVQIAGAFNIDYSGTLRLHASKLTVSNPDWSEHPYMLSVAALTAQLDLRALLYGRLVLPELRLEGPVLTLETTAQGPVNWELGSNGQPKSADHQWFLTPLIEHLVVSDGKINYYRLGKDLRVTATVDTLEARAAHGQPMSVSASGKFEGETYKLAASSAPIDSLINAAGTYPFSLQVSTASMEAHASGKLGAPLTKHDSDIQWSIAGSSLAELLPRDKFSYLNQGYKVEGRFQGGNDKWKLRDLYARLGQTELHGSMSLDTAGSKPFLRASFEVPVVDIGPLNKLAAAWIGRSDKTGRAPSLAHAWKRLDSVNAQVHLSVARIAGTSLPLKNLVLDSSLTDGTLKVDPVRVMLGDGQFSATMDLDFEAPSPTGKMAMGFDQLPVAPLLELLPYDVKAGGVLDGRLTLPFTADSIGAADGHVRYEAASDNTSLKFVLDRVRPSTQEWLVHLGVNGRLRGASVKGQFTGQPLALLAGSEMVPVRLDVALGQYRLRVEGSAADAGSTFDLKVAASGPGTRKLSQITGVDLPELASYEVNADLVRKRNLISVDSVQARVGQSRLSGSLTMDDLRKPEKLQVDLKAQTLAYADFDQLMAGEGNFPDLGKWLKRTDADIRLKADRIIGPEKTVFRQVVLDAALQDGHLNIAPLRFAAGGGRVNATVTVNNVGSGNPTGSLRAHVEHVRLSEALKSVGLGRRFPGVLDADIHFTTNTSKRKGDDSTIRYRDSIAGTDLRLAISTSPDQVQVKGQGRYQHARFWVDGTAGPMRRLTSPKPYPFEVNFKALDTSGHLAGTFGQPLRLNQLETTLTIRGPNPRRAESVVGFRMPELPPYNLTGRLTRRNGLWRFSDVKGQVGNSDLSGWIRVDNSATKPRIKATLHSEMLDLDDLGGIIGAAPGDSTREISSTRQKEKARLNRARSTVLPEEDFDFPSFLGFNADVHYSADKVNADKLPIDSMNMTFRVKDGRLHLVPLVVGAGGGTVRMDLHLVDTPGEMPVHGHIKLDIHRVSVARLLHPFDFAAGSAGLISGHGQFRSSGESVAAMLGSLNGEASLAMPNGQLNASLVELAGLDGGEALLLALEKEQTVDVNCAYIGATVRNGKLGIDTGLVDTTDTKFTMDGMIDFGKERLDLQILAHPKDASLFAVRAPLILEGTFRNPDFHPSWASLFARGAAALALGAIAPPAALLAFVEPGLGEGGAPCRKHLAHGLPVQHQ